MVGKGGGAISPKLGKLIKLGQMLMKMDKKESPTPAGLSSRGITRRGLWGALPSYQNSKKRKKKKHTYYVGLMTRWARELEGGLSTPRSWPLGVQFEGGERGALVDKVKKKRIKYHNFEHKI